MKVVDMHCDTMSAMLLRKEKGEDIRLRRNDLQIDLEKMKEGDYLIQNFAMFIHLKDESDPFLRCHTMMDLFYQEIEKNNDLIESIYSYRDIERLLETGKMGALLTIEEGGVAKGSLAYLRQLYRLGVRMITLTWNYENEIGYPNVIRKEDGSTDSKSGNQKDGLTPFGIEFIQEMERLGMIIDVSHLSDAGFYDVYHHTTKPFVASHSNARGVCPHCRNLSDDMILKLASRNGVLGINYFASFLEEANDENDDRLHSRIETIIQHIDYIKNLAGIDCIGLGSDYDGIDPDIELRYCHMLPKLEEALYQHGYTKEEVEKIFYKNVLRVYQEILK